MCIQQYSKSLVLQFDLLQVGVVYLVDGHAWFP